MRVITKNINKTFIIKVIGTILLFLLQYLLAKILNTDKYGYYITVITYTNILSLVSVIGMDRNLIKEIPRVRVGHNINNRKMLFIPIMISLSIGFIMLSILIIINYKFKLFNEKYSIVIILLTIVKIFSIIIDGYLQGNKKTVEVNFANLILKNILALISLMLINLIKDNITISDVVFLIILSEIIVVVIKYNSINKTNNEVYEEDKKRGYWKDFIKYSLTMFFITGLTIFIQNIDKIMISKMMSYADVGRYKITEYFVLIINLFISPFVVFWPYISKYYNEKKIHLIEKNMNAIIKRVIVFVIPVLFIILSLNSNLLQIFGLEFNTLQAQKALIILSIAFTFDAICGPVGAVLIMTEHAKYVLYNNIIVIIINIVLNLILIPIWGIVGAAVATGVSIIINNIISIIENKIIVKITIIKYEIIIQTIIIVVYNIIIKIILDKIISESSIANIVYILIISLTILILNVLPYLLNKKMLQYVFEKMEEDNYEV